MHNKKKTEQLGMSFSKACHRLRKSIMFHLAQQAGRDICFRCSQKIECVDDFSIEHKEPWLDSEQPIEIFFDLDNIAFSHYLCNVKCARRTSKKYFTPEDKIQAKRNWNAAYMRKVYTTARRRKKKQTTGW